MLIGAVASPASAADGTRYFFASVPDNYFGGYVARVRFKGDRAYLLSPGANSTCMKARRIKSRTWRFKEPEASEVFRLVKARFKTNKARTRLKFDNQYEDYDVMYKRVSRSRADKWLKGVKRSGGGITSWSNTHC